MSFSEERLNTEIRYGMVGGGEFNTKISENDAGYEQRISAWADSRGRWTLAGDVYNKTEMKALRGFFMARRGMFEPFRLKDWSDFEVAANEGINGVADGSKTYKLYKMYRDSGAAVHFRRIPKPWGTLVAYKDGVVDAASFDYINGTVTLTALNTHTITGLTRANPAVVTANAHSFTNGQKVWIESVGGMTQINDKLYTVANAAANTFELSGVDTRTGSIIAITKATQAVITTSNNHGFTTGTVTFTGIVGMAELNGLSVTIVSVTATTITINLDTTGFSTYVSGGSVHSPAANGGGVYSAYTSGGSAQKYHQPVSVTGTYAQVLTTITVTRTAHGYTVGQILKLTFTSGSAYSSYYEVKTVPNANTFTVTTSGLFNTSGNVTIETNVLSWSGEFDVPARFNTDQFRASFEAYRESDGEMLFDVEGIEVVEIRLP